MKLIVALIIQIQVFSLNSAVNFDVATDLIGSKVAAKRAKRAGSSCTVPPVTPDKEYTVTFFNGENSDAEPGEEVPQFTSIISKCNNGYIAGYETHKQHHKHYKHVPGNSHSHCINGLWEPPILKCKRICENFSHFSNFDMTCQQHYGGREISCNKLLLEGAIVIPKCRKKFRPNRNINYNHATCRHNGTWDKEFFKCIPDCGVSSNAVSLIANGHREKRGGAPWYIAIYSSEFSPGKPTFICGGTLISPELVVSAAHCFYDETFQKKSAINNYYAIVGKATPDFEIKDYNTTKTYRLKNISFSDITFKAARTNYAGDIVILQLSEKVNFSRDVFPACLYWDDRDRFIPGENEKGKLSGFGATEDGLFPSVLITADLPSISYSDCLTKVEEDFQGSISVDKFCAGSMNGVGARQGDSGGGLLFKDSATGLYHLRGVVSNKDSSGSSIATFTDVAQHISWILKTLKAVEHKSVITCEKPEVPPEGYIIGYNFNIRSIIKFHCKEGYSLVGQSEIICTDKGKWNHTSPRYVDCGKLPHIKNGSVHYLNHTTHFGSQVTYNCFGQYSLSDPLAVRICLSTGVWSGKEPYCQSERPSVTLYHPQRSDFGTTCNKPEVPYRGYITASDYPYNIKTIIHFHCEPGYLLNGRSKVICTSEGQWDYTSPTCEYIDCGELPPIKNGSVRYLTGTTHLGSEAVYICDNNYTAILDHNIRTCLPTGAWSDENIICAASDKVKIVFINNQDFDDANI